MENIIEEAKKGNLKAQNEICRTIRPKLLGFCTGLTGCRDMGEDLTQETLITVLEKLDKFTGTGTIEAWAKKIARNRFIDERRINLSRSLKIGESVSFLETHTEPEYYTGIERENSARKIGKAMDAIKDLPKGIQEVFVLHYVEGIKHKEISEMLGISEGTSKSQSHKGKTKIRKLLNRDYTFFN